MSVLTKKALVEAFGTVLDKKPFAKITVSDITNECGVSRMTFYYHFKDIHALIEWSLENHFDKALEGNYTYDAWRQAFLNVFQFALQKKQYILSIFPELDQKNIKEYLHGIGYKLAMSLISEKADHANVGEEYKRFISDTLAHACVGVLISWIENGMEEDPRLIVGKFGILFGGIIDSALMRLDGVSEQDILSMF